MMTYKWAAVLILCVLQGTVNAKIYRWTDEKGGTHFGQQLPAGHKDLRAANTVPNAVKRDPLPVTDSNTNSVSLNCDQAVTNGRYSLTQMRKASKENFMRGTINKHTLTESTERVDFFMNKLTVEQCELSTGFDQAFYTCVENYKNHILYCVEQFEGSVTN
jgi:hypothetical protein